MSNTMRVLHQTKQNPSRSCLLLCAAVLVSLVHSSEILHAQNSSPITVTSAYLQLDADIDIPAKETGVLKEINVKIGDTVEIGKLLGLIDDQNAILLANKAQLEYEIAQSEAKSESTVALSREELKVATADLARGQKSRNRFDTSFSQSELDQLALKVTEKKLKLDSALLEKKNREKKAQLARNTLDAANAVKERHRLHSTLKGMVVKIYRDQGEWVKPGDKVFRLVDLNNLRITGFIDATRASQKLIGCKVRVNSIGASKNGMSKIGKVIFVSPEVDSINKQVKVIALISNQDKRFNPGEKVEMSIEPSIR